MPARINTNVDTVSVLLVLASGVCPRLRAPASFLIPSASCSRQTTRPRFCREGGVHSFKRKWGEQLLSFPYDKNSANGMVLSRIPHAQKAIEKYQNRILFGTVREQEYTIWR